jgi:putative transposase
LEQRRTAYRRSGVLVNVAMQLRELPDLKDGLPELRDVYSQVLQNVLWRVDEAYKAFFRRVKQKNGKAGFPRFRSRRRYDSLTYPQLGFKIVGSRLHLSKIGNIKIRLHREIIGTIKTVTIKRDVDEWYAVFVCDLPNTEPILPQSEVGVDVGLESFLATSDGEFVENPRFLQKSLKKLRRAQRSLSRKTRGSYRRKKQVARVAKLHRTIARQRKDFQHKTAHKLVSKYDLIAIEDLNVAGMVKNHSLARGIADVAWASFANVLALKAEGAGKQVIRVAAHNTSQACSGCGSIVSKNLSVRQHRCPDCGLSLHRDVNAARNILLKSREREFAHG